MRAPVPPSPASQDYAAAYAANYKRKELPLALRLYSQVLKTYPSAPEADYARMQIQNIVNEVVSKELLLDAQLDLAFGSLGRDVASGGVRPQ